MGISHVCLKEIQSWEKLILVWVTCCRKTLQNQQQVSFTSSWVSAAMTRAKVVLAASKLLLLS